MRKALEILVAVGTVLSLLSALAGGAIFVNHSWGFIVMMIGAGLFVACAAALHALKGEANETE